ncbi:MAG: pilus assembly protein PilO [Deltaproteobacteria bacterium]|nr:MAG: pilus assembly protein PilO [Deltaproteobacteria bacterium]
MALKDRLTGKGMGTRQKIILYVLLFVLIGVAYFYLFYNPAMKEIRALEKKNVALQEKIREQRIIAKDLPAFKREVAKLEAQLNELLEQLPNSKEIPKLLRSISDVGKESGLEFVKFAPKGETQKDFYAEIPVEIEVTGGYHEFALFADRVSRLPRIVNISDVVFEKPKVVGDRAVARIKCTASTFRFVPKKAEEGKGKKKKKRRKRR